MNCLLDTHVWLWMLATPNRIRREVRALVVDPGNVLFLSAASSWEIAIKHAIGRLHLPQPPERFVPERMLLTRVAGLAVAHSHALRVASLPQHHRDPFDRLLVAQAQIERLPIVTADPVFGRYDVEVLRAD